MPNLKDLALSVESLDQATLKEIIKFKKLRRLHIYNGALLEPTIKREIETIQQMQSAFTAASQESHRCVSMPPTKSVASSPKITCMGDASLERRG